MRYTYRMFPVLFQFGPITIYTLSIFIMIAFFLGSYVFWRKGREEHYPEDELFDVFLQATFWAIIWSRIGYIIFHFEQFGWQPFQWLNIFQAPGFAPLFGLLAGAWSLYRAAQKAKWDEYEVLDFGVLAVVGMMAVIWLGNFLAGAELGAPTQLPWGVQFPNLFDQRHPLQLYAFVSYAALFGYLFWAEAKYRTFSWYRARKDSAQSGFLFAVFCLCWGAIGLGLWFVSANQRWFWGVPVEPILRLLLMGYGLVVLFQRSGRTWPWKKSRR